MWNYIYYTMYLEGIPVAERNHHEIYLHEQLIRKSEFAPFPIKRSGALEKRGESGRKGIADVVSIVEQVSAQGEQTQDLLRKIRTDIDSVTMTVTKGVSSRSGGRSDAGSMIGRSRAY